MKNRIIYDLQKHGSKDIIELNAQGTDVLCPTCRSKLLIVTSKSLVAKYKKPQGIFCPKNNNHVWIKFILVEERNQFWKKVEKRIKDSEKNN